jgi:hypothetical protein
MVLNNLQSNGNTTMNSRFGVGAHDGKSMVVLHQGSHIDGESNFRNTVLMFHEFFHAFSLIGRKLRQWISSPTHVVSGCLVRSHAKRNGVASQQTAAASMSRRCHRNQPRHSRDRQCQYQGTRGTQKRNSNHLSSWICTLRFCWVVVVSVV